MPEESVQNRYTAKTICPLVLRLAKSDSTTLWIRS